MKSSLREAQAVKYDGRKSLYFSACTASSLPITRTIRNGKSKALLPFLMVRVTGLEPALTRNRILNPARLPIPPYPRMVYYSINPLFCQVAGWNFPFLYISVNSWHLSRFFTLMVQCVKELTGFSVENVKESQN